MTNKIDASTVAKGIDAATGQPEAAYFILHDEPKIEDKRVLLQGLDQLEMYFIRYMQLQAKMQQVQENDKAYEAAKANAKKLEAATDDLPQGQVKTALESFKQQIDDYESGRKENLADVTQQAVDVYEKVLSISDQIQRARANLIADWNFADPYDAGKALDKPNQNPAVMDEITESQQEFINQHINTILNTSTK